MNPDLQVLGSISVVPLGLQRKNGENEKRTQSQSELASLGTTIVVPYNTLVVATPLGLIRNNTSPVPKVFHMRKKNCLDTY